MEYRVQIIGCIGVVYVLFRLIQELLRPDQRRVVRWCAVASILGTLGGCICLTH